VPPDRIVYNGDSPPDDAGLAVGRGARESTRIGLV